MNKSLHRIKFYFFLFFATFWWKAGPAALQACQDPKKREHFQVCYITVQNLEGFVLSKETFQVTKSVNFYFMQLLKLLRPFRLIKIPRKGGHFQVRDGVGVSLDMVSIFHNKKFMSSELLLAMLRRQILSMYPTEW